MKLVNAHERAEACSLAGGEVDVDAIIGGRRRLDAHQVGEEVCARSEAALEAILPSQVLRVGGEGCMQVIAVPLRLERLDTYEAAVQDSAVWPWWRRPEGEFRGGRVCGSLHTIQGPRLVVETTSVVRGGSQIAINKHSNIQPALLPCIYIHNIRSINDDKFHELKLVAENYDLVKLTESWLNDAKEKLYRLDGFSLYTCHRGSNRSGGGVAIYVKNHLSVSKLGDFVTRNTSAYWLLLLQPNQPPVIFGNVYHPPGLAKKLKDDIDVVIDDKAYHAKAGTRISLNLRAFPMDPKYVDNPTIYEPERFLPDAIEKRKGTPSEVVDHPSFADPFGRGKRRCLGSNIAISEINILTARLIQDYELSLVDPADVLKWKPKQKLMLKADPYPAMKLVPRM